MCVLLQVNLAQLHVWRVLWACLAGGHYTEDWHLQSDRLLPALVYLGGMAVGADAIHRLSMGWDLEAWPLTLLSVSLALYVQLVRNGEKDSWGPISNLDTLLPRLILLERTRMAVRPGPQTLARSAASGGATGSGGGTAAGGRAFGSSTGGKPKPSRATAAQGTEASTRKA